MKNEQYRLVLLFVVIPQEKCNLYFMIFHFLLFTFHLFLLPPRFLALVEKKNTVNLVQYCI